MLASSRRRVPSWLAVAGVLVGCALLPTSALAEIQFRYQWVGGSRFTLTLSQPRQLPGLPASESPKGWQVVCKETGPVMRTRIAYSEIGDTALIQSKALIAKRGTLAYKPFGRGESEYSIPTGGPTPNTTKSPASLLQYVYNYGSGIPVAPAPGLYDLLELHFSSWTPYWAWLPGVPTDVLAGKLDVRIGTAAECPADLEPLAYFRAR